MNGKLIYLNQGVLEEEREEEERRREEEEKTGRRARTSRTNERRIPSPVTAGKLFTFSISAGYWSHKRK